METIFILGLVGLTSMGAYLVSAKRLRPSRRGFRTAIGKMLESVGITLIFLAINLGAAVILILAVRGFTGKFISVYITNDVVWLGLSLLQGLTFQWWRELSDRLG